MQLMQQGLHREEGKKYIIEIDRDHSSATIAAKPTDISEILLNMSKVIFHVNMIQVIRNQLDETFKWKQGLQNFRESI